jgi:hypothetical protein
MKRCNSCSKLSPNEANFCINCSAEFTAYTGVTSRLADNVVPIYEKRPSALPSGARYVASGVYNPDLFDGITFERVITVYHGDNDDLSIEEEYAVMSAETFMSLLSDQNTLVKYTVADHVQMRYMGKKIIIR